MRSLRNQLIVSCLFLIVLGIPSPAQPAQTTVFTYQGKLTESGSAPNGTYQMQFRLFDSIGGPTQIGSSIMLPTVVVTDGVFTVNLDFGANAFNGADRFLEIAVKKLAGDPFTILNPRQQIYSSPYAIQTLKAQTADIALDSQKLGGVGASEYVTNSSTAFVRNQSTLQANSNFNISGNGTVGGLLTGDTVNAATQFSVGGNRFLSSPGTANVFLGLGSGIPSNPGNSNVFVGYASGSNSTGGASNTLVGALTQVGSNTSQFETVIGANASGRGSHTITLGTANESVQIPGTVFTDKGFFASAVTGGWGGFLQGDLHVAGSVGIGTISLPAKLNVQTVTNNYGVLHTDGTISVGTYVGGGMGWYGTRSNHPLSFFTNNGTEAMTITVGQRVGIGNPLPSFKLHVNGNVAGIGPYIDASDLRYKKDIRPIPDALARILRLRGVSYDWRRDEFPQLQFSTQRSIGLIGQEVEKVMPESVWKDEKGFYSVAYSSLVPVLVEAIKTQHAQMTSQQQQIDALKKRVSALERDRQGSRRR